MKTAVLLASLVLLLSVPAFPQDFSVSLGQGGPMITLSLPNLDGGWMNFPFSMPWGQWGGQSYPQGYPKTGSFPFPYPNPSPQNVPTIPGMPPIFFPPQNPAPQGTPPILFPPRTPSPWFQTPAPNWENGAYKGKKAEIEGTVVGGSGNTVVVQSNRGFQETVYLTPKTKVKGRLQMGARVEAKGRYENGAFIAKKLEVEEQEDGDEEDD